MLDLANKYRPRKADEIIGQSNVKNILSNIRETGQRVFLFSSNAPGLGKTTSARILALTVNCSSSKDGNPCLECDNCKAIMEGRSNDIIELNFANERGIDAARDLIEQTRLRPMSLKYRVVIIDEFHQATRPAQESLLKLFEEPPSHIYLICCTTNKSAIIETIRNRCIEVYFPPVDEKDIYDRLRYICEKEGIKVESEDALRFIAKGAGGSVRQSIKFLEQLKSNFTLESAVSIVGTSPEELIQRFVEAIIFNDLGTVIKVLRLVRNNKINISNHIKDSIEYTLSLLETQKLEVYSDLIISLTKALDDLNSDSHPYASIISETFKNSSLPSKAVMTKLSQFAVKTDSTIRTTKNKDIIINFGMGSSCIVLDDENKKVKDFSIPYYITKESFMQILNDGRKHINFLALKAEGFIKPIKKVEISNEN